MALVRSPDDIASERPQEAKPLPPPGPWQSMA